jgi:bifunctional polynucleotide phosphatase/kinase
VPIRCVHMTAPAKLCEHNDTVRALSDSVFNPEKRAILPHSAFASFASRFKEPKVQEGFQDVIRVEFQVVTPRVYIFLCKG